MSILSSLVEFTSWLLRISCQASAVIGLVLLAQWLFQKKLSPRWRYALWMVVLIRLALPVLPGSPFSIFNYTQGVKLLARGTDVPAVPRPDLSLSTTPSVTAPPSTSDERGGASSNANARSASLDPGARTALSARIPSANQEQADKAVRAPIRIGSKDEMAGPIRPRSTLRPLYVWLSFLWLIGAIVLAAQIFSFPRRLNAQLAQHETATGPAVFEVLEQSKRLIGVNRVLPIVQSRAVKSPALLGFIRPWLLLPDGMVERFTSQELRFVFLHELAHLKRRDIAVNWLMTTLQILHWFNPLVWFAFSRMRADRELACDELALSHAPEDDRKPYGQTIIKLLESFTRPTPIAGLVGILEDKQQMKRRITMIAQFKKSVGWPVLAPALVLSIGLVSLTDAQTNVGGESV